MLWILRYESLPGAADLVLDVAPRHDAYLEDFVRGGEVLLIGPLLPAPGSGAMAVFRSREAAAAFAASDPFVLEHVVTAAEPQAWRALEFLNGSAAEQRQ